jgi:hypothetical protein
VNSTKPTSVKEKQKPISTVKKGGNGKSMSNPTKRQIEMRKNRHVQLMKKEKKTDSKELTEFQKYLLSWPIMSDEEYQYIQEKRKHFNKWK